MKHRLLLILATAFISTRAPAAQLPARYFQLLASGAAQVESRLDASPSADLQSLEDQEGRHQWNHFPFAILAPAVLYAKKHPANLHYHAPRMLQLALQIGDLLAQENERGKFTPRLDSDWDTHMWLEAYRLLESELGEERRGRWKKAILENAALVYPDAAERIDFPWYNSPFIGTSPNHYAQYGALLLLAGRTFGNKEWEDLGVKILHRFAAEEQTPDGFWGEHSRNGPTTGYDHLTMTQVALYYEYTHDPAALRALRRSTTFHENFTYLDGRPVEVINDRNRYWDVDSWGHFGFSNFADGRRYAEFLTGFFPQQNLPMDWLGRLAQDALYYHDGPSAPIPQDKDRYSYQMQAPAGIRKVGPWVISLSGIIATQSVLNQFYLDRQACLSVFHKRAGLIISGANSKRQPEVATFLEKTGGEVFHLPLSSRLQMSASGDRLSLSYNTFFVDVYPSVNDNNKVSLRFVISGKGRPPEEARLNLQIVLKAGETLETGAGQNFTLSQERIELAPDVLGGSVHVPGWTLKADPSARLVWPICPFNPYANAPETTLDHAVGVLSVPLVLKEEHGHFIRPHEQEISFTLIAE